MDEITRIAESVVANRAALFFGAGISKCAGLPLWEELLSRCISGAEKKLGNAVAWIRDYAKSHDALIVAEMLQRTLGPDRLNNLLAETLEPYQGLAPSTAHRALAAIAWNQVITTNYDRLFESCLTRPTPVLTWRQASEYLKAIKAGQPVVFKMHGTIQKADTLILTRSEFGLIQHESPLLLACMSSLLLTKCFVFAGYSLRDPDLLHLIERNSALAGSAFGPHYLILPRCEVVPQYREFLKAKCGIEVIPIEHSDDPDRKWKTYEDNLVRLVRSIEGKVLTLTSREPFPVSELPKLSLGPTTNKLLRQAIERTGSSRGDVCIEQTESNSQLIRRAHYPSDPTPPSEIAPNQVIGTVFLNRRDKEDYIYLPDVCEAENVFRRLGYPRAKYIPCGNTVCSELAVPIYSSGHRSGVLNLEASETNRFSEGHIEYARSVAEHIGWVISEVARRNNTVNRFRRYFTREGIRELTLFLRNRRAISFAELKFALYEIDYSHGQLIAHSLEHNQKDPLLRHPFAGNSLAARVLDSGSPEFHRDADEAGRQGLLDPRGLLHFNISGPLAGFPVRLDGTIISVLVTWSANKAVLPRDLRWRRFRIASERVVRICRLLTAEAEDGRAKTFLESMDTVASQFTDVEFESARALQLSGSWERFIHEYLNLLLGPGKFTRIRLWIRDPECSWGLGDQRFIVHWSNSTSEATDPQRTGVELNRYRDRKTSDRSPFTALTLDRAPHDPYSRRQHKSVFGQPDPNCDQLDKNPNSEWAVVPLVKGDQIWGFVTGEVDVWDPVLGALGCDEVLTSFHHFSLDVIAHTLASFQPESLNKLWEERGAGEAGRR